ncbi:MAG: DUF4865 family protein [Alphaproteobacteria bacterium]|nr:DUF4865 family protein [Alphaproteobacteria bacterium]
MTDTKQRSLPLLAMQYTIPLPPGYDEAKIHERVALRSRLFDGHAGLVHKSFLYNDKEKLYAPFYLWKDVVEARDFLMDDLFKGVIEAFSRHRVRSWFVLQMGHGNRTLTPTYARRETDIIAPEERLDHYVAKEKTAQEALLSNPNLYMHTIAIDADRWEIIRFSLWKDKESATKPESDAHLEFSVLHVTES